MKNNYEIRGDVAIIFLKRHGQIFETVVDATDIEMINTRFVSLFCSYNKSNKQYYVTGKLKQEKGKSPTVFLHRVIMKAERGLVVDHINHDSLDNRRSNLRSVTHSQNSYNRKGVSAKSKLGVRNVKWSEKQKRYLVTLTIGGKLKNFGSYKTLEEADMRARELRAVYYEKIINGEQIPS